MGAPVRVRRVDAGGVTIRSVDDRPVDVLVEGRRVWTFWTLRDTEAQGRLAPLARGAVGRAAPGRAVDRLAAWPAPLLRHLDGRARIGVVDSVTGAVLHEEELVLGSGEGRVEVRNRDGVELGMDKSGKLVPTFAGRSERDLDALLDAVDEVVAALRGAGVDPFLAYGTLLGAVREGTVLGHDSDADLGYVSEHDVPVDVVLESFALQRRLAADGWAVERYSGGALKVSVAEGDVRRGLDVFGGFLSEGRLALMGEIREPFEESWIRPLGEATLAGRPYPVPAVPEELLAVTYGEGWRVPDPAFRFTTPSRTVRALDGWFRGTQPGGREWKRRHAVAARKPVRRQPTDLARQVADRARSLAAEAGTGLEGVEVLDVGTGRGRDALWLAREGVPTVAYDFAPRGTEVVRREAAAEDLPLEVRYLSLAELRSTLSEGCRLAHRPVPRVVLAAHLLEATSPAGREAFGRLCSMALRGAGGAVVVRCFTPGAAHEDLTAPDAPEEGYPEWLLAVLDEDEVVGLLRGAGAREVSVARSTDRGRAVVDVVGTW